MDKYPRTAMLAIAVPASVALAFLGMLSMKGCENSQQRQMAYIQKGYTHISDGSWDGLWLRLEATPAPK